MGDNLPAVSLGVGRTAIAIGAGFGHTCALLDDASVKCWGFNAYGQLGLGNTAHRGDGAGEMGNSLPAVSLGSGRTVKALAVAYYGNCALLDNATIKCWGSNTRAQLGLGDVMARGDGVNEMGDTLPIVELGTGHTAESIALGGSFACALLATKQVKCWGSNFEGQLGQGDALHRGDEPNEMGDNLPFVDLGTGRTAALLASGWQNCTLLDDESLKCWGYNNDGQLGLGDSFHRGDQPSEMGDTLPTVKLF